MKKSWGPFAGLMLLGIVMMVSFQNCQQYYIDDNVLSRDGDFQNDIDTAQSLYSSDEFAGSYEANYAAIAGDAQSRQGILNLTKSKKFPESKYNLFLKAGSRAPTATGSMIQQVSDASAVSILETPSSDNLISKTFSVVAYIKNTAKIDIISLYGGNKGIEEMRIQFDTDNYIRAYHITDYSNLSYAQLPIPNQEQLIVAASFDYPADKIALMVNGVISRQVHKAGNPLEFSEINRQFSIGTSVAGQVTWGEMKTFLRALTGYELSVVSRAMGARWGVPNMVDDMSLRTEDRGTPGGTNLLFNQAKAVLASKCLDCHDWAGSYSQVKTRIIPGNPAGSVLYLSLQGQGGTMPKGRAALSASEMAAISNWISSEK